MDPAAPFAVLRHPSPATPEQRAAAMTNPVFGTVFSDHMARATWHAETGWAGHRIVPLAPLPLHPGAAVLHYAQQVFEGLKAYRHDDGSIWLFRPDRNAERLADSARRLALPELPVAAFMAALEGLVLADSEWVPAEPGASLYLRPFLMATEPSLLVQPANVVEFVVTASPVGAYLATGTSGASIWVSRDRPRAVVGGTGAAKTAGNYAASMLPQQEAKARGCQQVLFLDARESRYVEELGGMNIVVVNADGSVRTPRLSGSILPGITRDSVLTLMRDQGRDVREEDIDFPALVTDIAAGDVVEVFACGTAAVVAPIGRLVAEGVDVTVGDGAHGAVATQVRDQLTGIQEGRIPDPYGWMRRVA